MWWLVRGRSIDSLVATLPPPPPPPPGCPLRHMFASGHDSPLNRKYSFFPAVVVIITSPPPPSGSPSASGSCGSRFQCRGKREKKRERSAQVRSRRHLLIGAYRHRTAISGQTLDTDTHSFSALAVHDHITSAYFYSVCCSSASEHMARLVAH